MAAIADIRQVDQTRVLFVAPQVPWPLDVGSKIRAFNLLQAYSQLGPLSLLCLGQDEADTNHVAALERLGYATTMVPLIAPTRSRLASVQAALRSLDIFADPLAVQHFRSESLAAAAKRMLAQQPDIVHVQRLPMMQYVASLLLQPRSAQRHPYLVLDLDDIESSKMLRMAKIAPWGKFARYERLADALRCYRYENRMLCHFDEVLVCSASDRSWISRTRGLQNVRVFGNGTDIVEDEGSAPSDGDGRTLCFFGAMNYEPNEDAVVHFVQAILPRIDRKVRGVRFVIAGKDPSERVRVLEDRRHVWVTGYVADKGELYKQCSVFVVPLRSGGGTRLKILEAMSHRRPVVSTSLGAEGLAVEGGRHLLVADSDEEFAHACAHLLQDRRMRETVGDAGHRLVREKYGWDAIRAEFVTGLRARLARRAEIGTS